MLCSQSFFGFGMSGICGQRHVIGNVFLFNVYKCFYSCYAFCVFDVSRILFERLFTSTILTGTRVLMQINLLRLSAASFNRCTSSLQLVLKRAGKIERNRWHLATSRFVIKMNSQCIDWYYSVCDAEDSRPGNTSKGSTVRMLSGGTGRIHGGVSPLPDHRGIKTLKSVGWRSR